MAGETLREMGVLLLVFGGILHDQGLRAVSMAALGVGLTLFGMFVERKRP